jgi:leader peptidase (prepilin peptidase)/N-methyltransferase
MIILILLYGMIIGSFLNVCIYRIPLSESISFPPSHCPSCKNKIKIYDLFPVISYILLKGKCRYCGNKISIRYPIIELLTGLLFVAIYMKFGLCFEFVKFVFFISFLVVIGIIDYDTTDVYLKTTLSGILIGIIFIIAGHFYGLQFMTYIYGGLLGGGLIAIIILLTHGMGWGDFEICIMAGLYLGIKLTILMLFLSFIIGGIVGVILIASKLKSRKDYIPFGPFIVIGSVLSLFSGSYIINLYFTNFIK